MRVPDVTTGLTLEGVVDREVVIRAHDRRPRYRPRKHQDRDEEEQQQRGE